MTAMDADLGPDPLDAAGGPAEADPVDPAAAAREWEERRFWRAAFKLAGAAEMDNRLALALRGLEARSAAHGISRPAIWTLARRLLDGRPAIGTLRAELEGRAGTATAFWQPSDDPQAPTVLTLPVIDGGRSPWTWEDLPCCSELLALHPADPSRWWRLSGLVWCLGEDAIERAREAGDSLRLIRHPLDWARAGGEASGAACVLEWHPEGVHDLLLSANLPALVCDDVEHGESVLRRQREARPQGPAIEVAALGQDARTEAA